METIIKSFFGIFFTLLLVSIGIGLISSSIEARNADIYLTNCVAQIQNSNFSSEVIEDCKSKAEEAGFELNVAVVNAANDSTKKYARLTLDYDYSIPIIGLDRQHTLAADIR